ncbi:MAG: VanZ family protein [Saprospiraceae bacterium]
MRSSFWIRILTGLWAIIIFVLSTLPGKQLPQVTWLSSPDKWAHAFVYGVLATGILLSWSPNLHLKKRYQLAFLLASLYGISMEIVQFTFFPGRYFEVWDIVANITGAFVALLFSNKFINLQ